MMRRKKIGVSIPEDLVAFADQTAQARGVSRSELLARLLESERVLVHTGRCLDRHGWDVVGDEAVLSDACRKKSAALSTGLKLVFGLDWGAPQRKLDESFR